MDEQKFEVEPEILHEFSRYYFRRFKDLENKEIPFLKYYAEDSLMVFRRGWYAALQTLGEDKNE